jgi:hypothetical protein
MKKLLLFIAAMSFITCGYSQATFNTGTLQVDVNAYGRIRLFTPDDTRHLQRASILVGASSTAVFDYPNDSEELDPTVLVENPEESDFEIYGAYDNSYSNLPPDVIVKLNAYGWTNGSYTVVKFNIENAEVSAIDALIGLDIIPELNQEYGFDAVTYNSEAGVIRFHRDDQVNMGIKLLSHPLTSLFSFEWYDGYSVDEDYWDWMNFGSLQPEYVSNTADGPVTITSQDAIALNSGQSVDVYYALALGADEATMLSNMAAAAEKYQFMLVAVEDNPDTRNELILEQNYPNPFNVSTDISYELPENGFVSLKVYDVTGREVAELVNAAQTAGKYSVQLDAQNLTDGLYFCTLRLEGQVKTMKIFKGR